MLLVSRNAVDFVRWHHIVSLAELIGSVVLLRIFRIVFYSASRVVC